MTLYWWIPIIIHLSKPIERATPKLSLKVHCGFWVIIMCQCRFIFGKKNCTILVSDVDNEEVRVCRAGNIWEVCVPFSKFCVLFKSSFRFSKL